MHNTFPRHRQSALHELQDLARRIRDRARLEPIKRLIHCLASKDFQSLVLPVNGEFISRRTQTTKTFGELQLPFPKFVLEYTMSSAGFESVKEDHVQHSATLTIVHALQPGAVEICSLWLDASSEHWNPSPIRLIAAASSEVQITPTSAVYMNGVVPIVNFGEDKDTTGAHLAVLSSDYADDLRVLVHFLMVCGSENITLEQDRAQTGHSGYFVKCTGPTSHQWLPTSGLSQ